MVKYREIPEMEELQLEKFLSLIDKTEKCWLWLGKRNKSGYGQFSYAHSWFLVPRIMYQLHHGDVNPYLMVCHDCDNPPCCNPEHLYLDCCSGNVQRSYDLKRSSKAGSENCKARLTEEKVLEIRKRCTESQLELAIEYGVSPVTINHVLLRRTWKHI